MFHNQAVLHECTKSGGRMESSKYHRSARSLYFVNASSQALVALGKIYFRIVSPVSCSSLYDETAVLSYGPLIEHGRDCLAGIWIPDTEDPRVTNSIYS